MAVATLPKVEDRLRSLAQEAVNSPGMPEAQSDPALARLRELGTELWLDTGNLEEAQGLWRREFSALTTNNTLVNQVVQTGILDEEVRRASLEISAAQPDITEEQLVLELGFVANCMVALRLVKAFGAHVSVELHPSIANDIDRTMHFVERYYAICPERFYIKIPLTPEGYCAVARARAKGIPINYTLGFSARQNYLAALFSNPTYCNVFLGRLNSFVSDNHLGDGKMVGEKAAMATYDAVRELHGQGRTQTKVIAASMRSPDQVQSLAGMDVFTMPPKVAKAFMEHEPQPNQIPSQAGHEFEVNLNPDVDQRRISVLWDIDDSFKQFADDMASGDPLKMTGDDLRTADANRGIGLFHRFTSAEVVDIREHGKIPRWDRWKIEKRVALDDLMTQSALQSFVTDQAALDSHLKNLIVTEG